MTQNLATLKAAADALWPPFMGQCWEAGFSSEWEAYRAEMRGEPWPAPLAAAHNAYVKALHAFYGARDGDAGFLGSRGL